MKLASTPQRAAPTDKCTASRNVLDSIDQWRPLFERSALGVAMIDSGFHFLTANPAFLTMFGYSSEELQQVPRKPLPTVGPSSLKNLTDPGVRRLLNHVHRLVAVDSHIKV